MSWSSKGSPSVNQKDDSLRSPSGRARGETACGEKFGVSIDGNPLFSRGARPSLLEAARKMSERSLSEQRLGCVIARRGHVVALGVNDMRKTHPRAPTPFKTLHAEIDALVGADATDLVGADCYVYRQSRLGEPAMAKPCPACEGALRRAGIKRCFYTVGGRLPDGRPIFAVLEFD